VSASLCPSLSVCLSVTVLDGEEGIIRVHVKCKILARK
jgi:hypothetical protein